MKGRTILPLALSVALLALLAGACTQAQPASGPTATATPIPAAEPPTITHTLVGREDCLVCHKTGIGGAIPVPASHEGRTNDTCTLCHKAPTAKPTPTPAAQPTPTPTPTPAAPATPTPTAPPGATPTATPTQPAQPTPTPTPTPAVSGPPAIPHTLAGREQCLACHGSGMAGIPQVPADHEGRANGTCALCHKPQ